MPQMRPCCIPCQREMELEKSGKIAVSNATALNGPYFAVMADLYKCKDCGHEILAGFGQARLWEHFQCPMPFPKEVVINIYEWNMPVPPKEPKAPDGEAYG